MKRVEFGQGAGWLRAETIGVQLSG